MYRLIIIGILPGVFVLSSFSQYISNNEAITDPEHIECAAGITSFSPICSIETLDSVVHFDFTGGANPNISSKVFYFDEHSNLDSIREHYFDQTYNYVSGNTTAYSYDESGRVSDVYKTSWNSSIQNLAILIQEAYVYEDGFFSRFSNIEWRTAHDISSVDVKEEYAFDDESQLTDYTMFVPHEINPDNAIYKEEYNYDNVGSLSYMSKDLSEAGASRSLLETRYQNIYQEQNLPWLIHATSRENGEGSWEETGRFQFFYDEMERKTMLTETKNPISDPIFERRNYSYDQYNRMISEVRYISSDSVQFVMADSTIYYHSAVEEEEEELPGSPEYLELQLFPNPTADILHIRSEIDSPSTINVIDASGRVILSIRTVTGVADIDLSPYPSGYYVVTLTSMQGYHTGKVFKY